jgi:hypothetical protein
MGFIRKAQNGFSAGIPFTHCWTSPLSYYLDKIRYSKGTLRKSFSMKKKCDYNTNGIIIQN